MRIDFPTGQRCGRRFYSMFQGSAYRCGLKSHRNPCTAAATSRRKLQCAANLFHKGLNDFHAKPPTSGGIVRRWQSWPVVRYRQQMTGRRLLHSNGDVTFGVFRGIGDQLAHHKAERDVELYVSLMVEEMQPLMHASKGSYALGAIVNCSVAPTVVAALLCNDSRPTINCKLLASRCSSSCARISWRCNSVRFSRSDFFSRTRAAVSSALVATYFFQTRVSR